MRLVPVFRHFSGGLWVPNSTMSLTNLVRLLGEDYLCGNVSHVLKRSLTGSKYREVATVAGVLALALENRTAGLCC